MPSQTPTVPFIAGLCLAPPVHLLTLLNGSVFGVSGFVHRAFKRDKEALNGVFGLAIGGAIVGLLERTSQRPLVDLRQALVAGFLVGFGTKVSPIMTCYSVTHINIAVGWMHIGVCIGIPICMEKILTANIISISHMLCGLSRFSSR